MRCFGFGIIHKNETKIKRSPSRKSKNCECIGAGNGRTGSQSGGSIDFRVFAFAELKNATRNFSPSFLIRENRPDRVYRGSIQSIEDRNKKVQVVVKQMDDDLRTEGLEEWVKLINVLRMADHANLVELVGYCVNDVEGGPKRLMVYEFLPNSRSLDDHLHLSSGTPLTWNMRLRVAEDAARGLAYLHEELELQVIFRDFKSSNILLDETGNAKLSDFGLALLGPEEGSTNISTEVVGTYGYADPQYIATGCITSKADVWSYGVLLYELITGRRPVDRKRPKKEQLLVDWVKPYKSNLQKFKGILDPKLDVESSFKQAAKLASIADRCLVQDPENRPKMSQVLEMVKKIVDGVSTESEMDGEDCCFCHIWMSNLIKPCCASKPSQVTSS